MSDQENEVLNEVMDAEILVPTAGEEEILEDHVEQDSQTECVSAIPQVDSPEAKVETDAETTSLSTAAFRTIAASKNLLDLLERLPVPNDFDREIDEISLFLGRTMNSITQKLA